MQQEHNSYIRKISIQHPEVQPYRDTPIIISGQQMQDVVNYNAIPMLPNTIWCTSTSSKVYGQIQAKINDQPVTLQQIRSGAVVKSQTLINHQIVNVFPTVINQPKVTWCEDIFCMCEAPEFEKCQTCVGCMNFVCGLGLCFGSCCCYGKTRPDCLEVCSSGFLMFQLALSDMVKLLGALQVIKCANNTPK
ncbi:Cysteine-rich_membrane protein 2 [Hexamita inflata]|uniref:Cysteine-rich membrane protein 2 n=1 Tax=Hexamita inflata TaxID=28002 RepID=A0AA86RIB4_9EUKA|nr:Cysteine-rich membrane protein 2 [Hexamita inflata]